MLLVRTARNAPGLAVLGRLICTVSGSTAVTLSAVSPATSVNRNAGGGGGWIVSSRLKEYTTSSAVMGLPLANLLPGWSLKVSSQ